MLENLPVIQHFFATKQQTDQQWEIIAFYYSSTNINNDGN
jgi:hypothetical protein